MANNIGILNLKLFLKRNGLSINLYVTQAKSTDKRTQNILIVLLGVSLSKILANDNNGQCHKYNGKLISPNQTKILFDNIFWLI